MGEVKSTVYKRLVLRVLLGLLSVLGCLTIVLCLALWTFVESHEPSDAGRRLETPAHIKPPRDSGDPRELYLELLKRTLTRYQFGERYQRLPDGDSPKERLSRFNFRLAKALVDSAGFEIIRVLRFDPVVREHGQDWPHDAVTMIGIKRLDNLQHCVTDVLQRKIPGDFIECGAWRGGACIFMRAILKAYGDKARKVWVADSFEGLPEPSSLDVSHKTLFQGGEMAVSLEQVRQNFRDYGMLDDQVVFLKGFFADTLPTAAIEKLAILRLDADLYESTMLPLDVLFDRVSPGGYVIVDDWNLESARTAVEDFRARRNITDPILPIDKNGVYWQKTR